MNKGKIGAFIYLFCPINPQNIRGEFELRGCQRIKNKSVEFYIHHIKCGVVKLRSYHYFLDTYLKDGTTSCRECQQEKTKKVFREKYGVDHFSQTQLFNDKMRETSIKNWGVEHPLKAREVIEKRFNTCIEKYGFENPFQNEQIKEKSRQTNIKKFGVEYYAQTEESKNFRSQLMIEKIKNGLDGAFNYQKDRGLGIESFPHNSYKSTWEVQFQLNNPTFLYEQVRIPYVFNGRSHIYIVDFVDPDGRILYEIKPMFEFQKSRKKEKNIAKVKAAIEWAKYNQFKFKVVTEKNYKFFR